MRIWSKHEWCGLNSYTLSRFVLFKKLLRSFIKYSRDRDIDREIMPSKKKKYNARFPAGRIKKIMQTDEDVGKVAQAVPVIISRTLELFVESLLRRAMQITSAKNAKTLTPSHMKQCILSESRFDFLKDLVKGIPDVSSVDDESGTLVGNVSPGITPPAKSPSSFTCYQFRRKSDGGASKSSATTSQLSSVPQTPLPKFYKEIAIGSDDNSKEEEEEEERIQPTSCRAPVIQHTGPRLNDITANDQDRSPAQTLSAASSVPHANDAKYGNCISRQETNYSSSEEIEEDDDDDHQENGFHRLQIVTKNCAVDEDYDT